MGGAAAAADAAGGGAAGWKPPSRGGGRSTASVTACTSRPRNRARSELSACFPSRRWAIQSGTARKIGRWPTRISTLVESLVETASVIRVS